MTRSIWALIAIALIPFPAIAQNVVQNPTGTQAIVQPPNTNFIANNYVGITL